MSAFRTLRAGVVGVGMIGELHARCYAADARTELVGVVDIDRDRAREVATTVATDAYVDVEDLLIRAQPDVLSVAVPEDHRHGPAMAAAEAGVHLLLEKPLAPTLPEVDRLVEALTATGVTVMVNFILRSDPRYLTVRDAVVGGELGELCTLSARRVGTSAGAELYGPWTDLLISTAIHDLDVMRWIVDAPVVRVHAEAVVKRCAEWGHEDAVVATLRFASGAVAVLETSWVLPTSAPAPLSSGLRVVGTGGAATIEGNDAGVSLLDSGGMRLPDLMNWPVGRSGVEGNLRTSIQHFIGCVLDGGEPVMGLAEAREAQEIVAALKTSIAEERPIELPLLDVEPT